tara:strand:- start:3964 stop:4767 length:804 start_codon:yes stop_codon:yes gene_type:complete
MDKKVATYRGKDLNDYEHEALKILVQGLAPDPEEYRINESNHTGVHPMGVHVTSVPGKKVEGLPAYKVTKVGTKVKAHGGLKVGEHIHDNHIDDLADMGHKIKTEGHMMNGKKMKKGPFATTIANNGNTVSGPEDQLQKEEVDFTIIEHDAFTIELPEEITYEDFLVAAQSYTEDEDIAVELAEEYFNNQDLSLIIEDVTKSDIEDRIKVHKDAGSKVSAPKYGTKDGKVSAQYTVTDKKGTSRKHIHYGSVRRVENLGTTDQRKED